MKQSKSHGWLGILFMLSVGLQAQHPHFKYKRPVEVAEKGWYSIPLADDMFGKLRPDFGDIRLVRISANGDTSEVPCLTESAVEQSRMDLVSCRVLNKSQLEGIWYYTLHPDTDITVNNVDLHVGNETFDWTASLEGSNDEQKWFSLVQNYRLLRTRDEGEHVHRSSISLNESRYKYYRLSLKGQQVPLLDSVRIRFQKLIPPVFRNYRIKSLRNYADEKRKQQALDVELAKKAPVCCLRVWVKPGMPFARAISVQSQVDSILLDGSWKPRYQTLHNGMLEHTDSNAFSFQEVWSDRLRITIDQGDNEPLMIDSVTVSGYEYRVTARFDAAGAYWLLYGDSEVSLPRYDIVLLRREVFERLPILLPGEEVKLVADDLSGKTGFLNQKVVLWIVMVVAAVSLGLFALLMMRKRQAQ